MAYLGRVPATGENNAFRILDDISSYVLTFDGSSANTVSLANDTIALSGANNRFITGQRVVYSKGSGGTIITGLAEGAHYVVRMSDTTIKLAPTANDALNQTNLRNFTGLGAGTAHKLTLAFDGINTKFKATYENGTQKPLITRAAQLVLSINGVIQQPVDSTTPSVGFGFDVSGVIIFSTAPSASDTFWGHVLASNTVTFDISDNNIDKFTGNGTTTEFNLSKKPPDNRNILVTIDGVIQYPSDNTTTKAYGLSENKLQFTSAPANGADIQVRHIGFAGASGGGGGVSSFYGRTGSVVLKSTDNPTVGNLNNTGTLTVTGDATFSGNVAIAKTLTYMDVSNIDSVGVSTFQDDVQFNGTGVGISSLTWDKSANSLDFKDGIKARFGDSQDLSMYHDGINAYQVNTTGSLVHRSTGEIFIQSDTGVRLTDVGNNETFLRCIDDGAVELYHGMGSGTTSQKKLETTSTGVMVNDDVILRSSGELILNNAGNSANAKILCDGGARINIQSYAKSMLTMENGQPTIFYTSNETERLRIQNDGKVGIGTNVLPQQLTSFAVSGYPILAQGTSAAIGIGPSSIVFGNKTLSSLTTGIIDATDHSFKISGTEKVSITSDGMLHISDRNSGNAGDHVFQAGSFGIRMADTGGYNRWNIERNYGGWQSVPTVHLSAQGRVGIATADPGSPLEVSGGTALDTATFNSHHADGVLINLQRGGSNKGFLGSGKNIAPATGGADDIGLRSNAHLIFTSGGGTERLRITSGGQVNIGGDYTSTTSTLRVIGSSTAGSQTYLEKNSGSTNNAYHTALTISARSTGSAAANYGPAIGFQHAFGSSNYAGCLIASQSEADVNTASIRFYPRNYGYSEALRITLSGQIKKIQDTVNRTSLKAYSGEGLWFDHYQLQSSGTYQRYADIASIGDGSWGSNLRFHTMPNGGSATERLRIDSDGMSKFTRGSTGTVAHFYANAREANILIQNDAKTWKIVNYDYGNNGTDHLGFHDGSSDRLVIGSNGCIGIGPTNPSQYLHVESSSNQTARVSAHGFMCRDNWGIHTNIGNGMFSPRANHLAFATNSHERMCIDGAGRLLIGVTSHSISSSQSFEVSGMSYFSNNSSSTGTIYIRNHQSDTIESPHVIFTDGSGNRAGLSLNPADQMVITGQTGVSLKTGGTVGGGSTCFLIDNQGRTGINCTPTNMGSTHTVLHVNSKTAVGYIGLTNTTTGNNASQDGFNIIQDGVTTKLFNRESTGNIEVCTNSEMRMKFDNDEFIYTGAANGSRKTYPIIGGANIGSSDDEVGQFNYHDVRGPTAGIGGWVNLGVNYYPAAPWPVRAFKIAAPESGVEGTRVYQVWHDGDANYDYGGMWEVRINQWTSNARFESVAIRCINGKRDDLRVWAYQDSNGIWLRPSTIWGQVFIRRAGWDTNNQRSRGSSYCAVANGAALAIRNQHNTGGEGSFISGYTEVYAFNGSTATGGYDIENSNTFNA